MTHEPAADDTWTIARLLRFTTEYLAKAGVSDARLCAELLLAHALGCAKIELYTRFDHEPSRHQRGDFRALVQKAARHHPIAYLIGRKEFYSLEFEVTPDVLIPRPETETLVDRAIALCRESPAQPVRLLDMGTGSGCIALAILSQVDHARAVATDWSSEALQVAARNAAKHGLTDRLSIVQADRLDLPPNCIPAGGFDLIVSNPPYIADHERDTLPATVRDYEPHQALFAGPDGLSFYRTIHDAAPGVLKPGGVVLVEVGAELGDKVRRVMETRSVFEHNGTWRDAADGHDRVMQFALRTGSAQADRPARPATQQGV